MGSRQTVRKTPCVSCPYRRDVPSGVWAASEYEKLPLYDGTTTEQAINGAYQLFECHQTDGNLCAGWVGCHDMDESLAMRMHHRQVDPAVYDYESPVSLFSSGAEAAEHGMRDIDNPGPDAREAQSKITRVRSARGRPVQ